MSARILLGAGLATVGAIVIGVLVASLYGSVLTDQLIWLGIPGALLSCLLGLCLVFFGGAIAARRTRRGKGS